MPRSRSLLAFLLLLPLAGCQQEVGITEQKVTRLAVLQRFLGAVAFPPVDIAPDKYWTFTVSGPESAVVQQKENFNQFIRSVRFEKVKPPTWKLPMGWSEEKGKDFRFATVWMGPGKDLELIVSPLDSKKREAHEEDFQAQLVHANMQRWQTQIGLKTYPEGDLENFYEVDRSSIPGSVVYWIDMLGPRPRTLPKTPAKNQLPFDYTVPEGWRELPPDPLSVLTLGVLVEDEIAKLTVTPLGNRGGGLLENINRWRGQVGLEPIQTKDLSQAAQETQVSGKAAHFVDIRGGADAPANRNRIMGVIFPHGENTWFFKLTGPTGLLEQQKPQFDSFMQSIAFQ